MKNFRCYQMALELYKRCTRLETKGEIRDQLHRASLSVVLNLAEGYGRRTKKDQNKYFSIALGSLRETQAIIEILGVEDARIMADRLGGSLFRLTHG